MYQRTPFKLEVSATNGQRNPFFDAVSRALQKSLNPSQHAGSAVVVFLLSFAARFAQMKLTRKPRPWGRGTFPSRPRSRICQKKKSLVKRVASTLRRRRSQFCFAYQNKLTEMAESRLNLPHEGQPGLIYAVPEIPNGHSRQSLIDIFDDVVANMSASTVNSSSQRSWETYQSSQDARSLDILTGKYDTPEDFDRYLTWQPLDPSSAEPSSNSNGKSCEPAELTCSAPRTPSRASSVSLIDLDTPTSTGPPTPPNAPYVHIDELFFGGVPEALTTPALLPSQSLASLDEALYPRPLNFKDSPYPVLKNPNQPTPNSSSAPRKLQKRTVRSNLKIDTQHPALRANLSSTTANTPTRTQPSRLIHRKRVQEIPTRHNQWLTPAPLTAYRPYRPVPAFPHLPPVPTPTTDSLLDEIQSEIDKVMKSFSPAASATEQKQPDQAPPPPPPQSTITTSPLNTRAPPRHIQIPVRTTSRAAPTTTSATAATTPTRAASFHSRLGASTLNALLRATDSPSSPSFPSSPTFQSQSTGPNPSEYGYSYGYSYSWHRWVGDPDSETEEREYSRRWRERRRGERRRGDWDCEGEGQCESKGESEM
jgi:hypothetical protein